jgi:glyoxylase-like metal-dependent hydrolase (beta-lactamase superfamily II)
VRDRPIVAHGENTEIAARLVFLGTRGEIPVRSRRHRRHSSLLVEHASARVMIDCGTDWRSRVHSIQPTFIVLTHGHPDHAWGLADGAPCPVYATQATLELIADYPIREPRLMPLRTATEVGGIGIRGVSGRPLDARPGRRLPGDGGTTLLFLCSRRGGDP